jgi:hypothetical protein
VVEHLPSKHEALSSNPSTIKIIIKNKMNICTLLGGIIRIFCCERIQMCVTKEHKEIKKREESIPNQLVASQVQVHPLLPDMPK